MQRRPGYPSLGGPRFTFLGCSREPLAPSAGHTAEIDELSARIRQLQAANSGLQQRAGELEHEAAAAAQSSARRLEDLRLQHDEQLDKERADKETHKSKSAELEEQVGRLGVEVDRLARKNSRLESENSQLENKNTRLESENSQLENKNTRLESENSQLESENSQLESENSRLESENSQLKSENTRLESENTRLENENSEFKSDNNKLIDAAERLADQSEVMTLDAELKSAQAKIKEHDNKLRKTKSFHEGAVRRLEEEIQDLNAKLHEAEDTIETLRDSLGIYRVLCQVRPEISQDKGRETAQIERRGTSTLLINNDEWHFNHVFTQASPFEMFNIVWPVLRVITSYRRVCLMALGRTCSGKTYTLRQLLSMAVGEVLKHRYVSPLKVYAQFVEIYRKDKYLYDLGGDAKTEFQYNEADRGPALDGCRSVELKDKGGIGTWIRKVEEMRATAPTAENLTSSRSHLLILIKIMNENGELWTTEQGTLAVFDLAGDEDSSDNSPERVEESKFINLSLSHLRQYCTNRLENPSASSRGQLLTSLFRRFAGERTLMLLNLSPLADDIPRARSLLEFTNQLQKQGKARVGPKAGPGPKAG